MGVGDLWLIISCLPRFASVDIMHWFGYLLEDFHDNGAFVNDCIFTMLHHVSGEGHVSLLFQPIILKAFSKIWDQEFEMCDDWADLVEYVINKFISNPQPPQRPMPIRAEPIEQEVVTVPGKIQEVAKKTKKWTDEELDSLSWYYAQAKGKTNPIEEVSKHFEENGLTQRTSQEMVEQLLTQGLVDQEEALRFCPEMCNKSNSEVSQSEEKQESSHLDEELRKLTVECPEAIEWLQQVLLECAFIKRSIEQGVKSNKELIERCDQGTPKILEPIALINICELGLRFF